MPDSPFSRSLSARLSPDEYRRRLALMLVQGGLNTSPIQSPWQGAARMAQAFMGGLLTRNLQEGPPAAAAAPSNTAGVLGPARAAPPASASPPPRGIPRTSQDAFQSQLERFGNPTIPRMPSDQPSEPASSPPAATPAQGPAPLQQPMGPRQLAGLSPDVLQFLRDNPHYREQFEAQFGPGAADYALLG
jgi:hypothetical protein